MANTFTMWLDTLLPEHVASVGDDLVHIAEVLGSDEQINGVATGLDPDGAPLLLIVTDRRVVTPKHSIPLCEVTSIATSGNALKGCTVVINGEQQTLRASAISFPHAQRFVASVRAGVARAEAAIPSWLPAPRSPENSGSRVSELHR